MQSKSLVLAVDDDLSVNELLRRALGQAGYEVITASNGTQGLEMVALKQPDLVLLDIKMPGKSGIEVLGELRTNYPDIAVVMATGVADVSVAIKALTDGAYGYLNKPFNVNELILMVERALERRRIILENREYQADLERKVNEQTQALQQKIKELTALNNLFATYLNQGFEAADQYFRLAGDVMKAGEEIQALAKLNQGFEAADRYFRLAGDIMKAGEEIQALAKEAQAMRIGVETPPSEKQEESK